MPTIFYSRLGFMGRIGNIMWEIACVVAVAKKYKANWLLPTPIPHLGSMNKFVIAPDYDLYFKDKIKDKQVPASWINKQTNRINYYYYDTAYKEIDFGAVNSEVVIDLDGNLQSPKYFSNAEAEVRELFSLEKFKEESDKKINEARRVFCKSKVIGVGMRLTDYIVHNDFYHQLHETDYYQKAFKYFNDKYNNDCVFMVFSDDIELAKMIMIERDMSGYTRCFDDSVDDARSLALMSFCDGMIMSNSTFHWWGAWLGDKNIIAPKLWYKKPQWDAKDIYTDKMIKM